MKTQQNIFSICGRRVWLVAGMAIAALLLLPGHGIAQSITLTNGGSSATIDLGGSDGMNNWEVDTDPGVNQLSSQWFYYSVNGSQVESIDTIGGLTYSVTGGDILDATYSDSLVTITVQYSLQGAGSGSGNADILSDTATATSVSSLSNLKVFEYANFDLLGNGNNNSISISPAYGGPPLFPFEGYGGVSQMNGATALSETIDSPYANFAEAGTAGGVLGDVKAGSTQDLNDNLSEGMGNNDVAWALEWSYQNVASGTTENVLQDQQLSIGPVPEPSTFALIALGLGAIASFRRRSS